VIPKVSETTGTPNWIRPVCTAAVIALALASVPVALGHMSHSVWYDESQTHLIARQGTLGGITALAMHERPYPPLFFFVVHYSLLLRDDETGLRLPAALFGALTVLAVFFLGSALVDHLTGAVAAFLVVLTPGSFRYFVDGNAYTLLMLASALSTLYLWRATHSDAMRDWLPYAGFALVGLGTHLLFAFHVAAQMMAGAYLRSRTRPAGARPYQRLAWTMSLLLGLAMLWGWYYRMKGGHARPIAPVHLLDAATLVSMAGMYVGPQSIGSIIALALWVLLQVAGAAYLFRSRRRDFWALAILIAVPIVAITVFVKLTLDYVAYRYTLGIFPFACVVAATAWKLWPKRLVPRAGIALVILAYWVSGAAFITSAGEDTFGYQDWRGATRYLAQRFSAGDDVLVSGQSRVVALTYYWKASKPTGVGTDPSEIADHLASALPSSGTAAPRAWVFLSTFANENPLVARFTESRRRGNQAEAKELAQVLEKHGLRLCRTAAFRRVMVVEVRRGPCEEAP
jgi:hypothetical protein